MPIIGTKRNDTLTGTTADDLIKAGKGDDVLNGGEGDDMLLAGKGDDVLNGGEGTDWLVGGEGNDILTGGAGDDWLDGGAGWDIAQFSGDVRTFSFQKTKHDWRISGTETGTDELYNVEELQFDNFTVYLDGRNNAPLAVDDTATISEDASAPTQLNLIANDWDFEGDTLSISDLNTSGIIGLVTIVDAAAGTVSYGPNGQFENLAIGETAVETFSYTLGDSQGGEMISKVTITITGENDAPVVSNVVATTMSEDDAAFTVDMLEFASDVDNGALLHVSGLTLTKGNASGVTQDGDKLTVNTSAYQYLAVGESEVIVYSYTVTDEHGASVAQTATITITGANDTPEVSAIVTETMSEDDANFSVDLLQHASDVDNGAVLHVENLRAVDGNTSGITLNGNSLDVDLSAYQYLAVGETESIPYSFDVVDEFGAKVGQMVRITITGENDAPTVEASVAAAASEDDDNFSVDLLQHASDVDNDAVLHVENLQATNGNATGITLNENSLDVDLSAYQYLAVGDTEVINYSYDVTDENGASVTQTATITITGANDAPEVSAYVAGTMSEDEVDYTVNLLQHASDVDNGAVLHVENLQPIDGYLSDVTLVGDSLVVDHSAFQYLAVGEQTDASYSFDVVDELGAKVMHTVHITITGENDKPTVEAVVATTDEETSVTGAFDGDDVDTSDVDGLTYQITSGPEFGDVVNNNDGTFTYSANGELDDLDDLDEGESLDVTFEYKAIDAHGAESEVKTGTITVAGVTNEVAPLLTLGIARGPGTLGAEFQINTHTGDDQDRSTVTTLADGSFVVTWTSWDQDAGNDDNGIFGQHFDAEGRRDGPEFQINSSYAGSQSDSAVTALKAGGFLVAWHDSGSQTINGQRYDTTGNQDGEEFIIVDAVDASNIFVAQEKFGTLVVTYTTYSPNSGTYGQRFDSLGTPIGSEVLIESNAKDAQMIALANGGFVMTWAAYEPNGNGLGIYGQRFDNLFQPAGEQFLVNSDHEFDQSDPAVTALANGGFVVTWTTAIDGYDEHIRGQLYGSIGEPVGEEFQINTNLSYDTRDSSVTTLADGGFVVTWTSWNQDGSKNGIFGQRFDAQGDRVDGEFQVNTHGENDQFDMAVSALPDGGFVVTWTSEGQDGSGDGVYGQRFSATDAEILQGQDIYLDVEAALAVDDGSQTLSVVISGMPNGASLSAGIKNGDGSWTLAAADLNGLILHPAPNSAVDINLTYTAITTFANGQTAETTLYQTITVQAVSNAPLLEIGDARMSGTAGDEFQIDSHTGGEQQDSSVTALADGGFVVTWTSVNRGGSDDGIIGQLYDASGASVGGEFLINSQTGIVQSEPTVTALDNGGFVVTWTSSPQDGSGTDVYGQRFDALGGRIGGEILINSHTDLNQDASVVTALTNGDYVVTWTSEGQDGSGAGVYGQRYTANGEPLGAEFLINSHTGDGQWQPAVTALTGGGFVVTWTSEDQDGSGYGVYGQRYSATGVREGDEFQINNYSISHQHETTVAALADGGFLVAWTSDGQDNGASAVMGQRYTASGAPAGDQFQINSSTGLNQFNPAVTALAGGGFAVTWTSDNLDGTGTDVYGQRFDALGGRIDGEILINGDTNFDQDASAVTVLANGDFVVTWTSNDPDSSGSSVFGQRFRASETEIQEDQIIFLDVRAALAADDGSQTLSIVISGVPDGASLSAGVDNNDGSWTLSIADLVDLSLQPPLHFAADIELTFTATTTFSDGETAATAISSTITVAAVADTPVLSIVDQAIGEEIAVGDEFQVNTTELGAQGQSAVSTLADGGYVVTWTSADPDSDGWVVYGQRYDASGTRVDGEFQINSETGSNKPNPAVAALDGGGFVVTWTFNGNGEGGSGFNDSVFGQLYNAAGDRVGDEFEINSHGISDQNDSSVTALADGGFIVTWTSYNQDAGADDDGVYGQRYDASGARIGNEFQINSETHSDQNDATVTALADGGFIVTWTSWDQDGSRQGVFAQRYDAAGDPEGGEFQINSTTNNDQSDPAVTAMADGGFVITWTSEESGTSIYGQRYDASGTQIGAEFQIVEEQRDGPLYAYEPHRSTVTALADGGFVVTWTYFNEVGSVRGIYAQRYDALGDSFGDAFRVGDARQYDSSVTALDDGSFVVTSSGLGQDVFAQRFAAPLQEDMPVALGISASLVDQDGSETLTIIINDVPEGASLSDGTDNGDGSWTLSVDQLEGLMFTPPEGFAGRIDLTVTALSTETSNGDSASTTQTLSLLYQAVDDVLVSSLADDTLTGGAGDDLFVFDDGSGDDTITDFTAGEGTDDVLDFSAHSRVFDATDLTLTQQGGDTLVEFGDDSVLLKNVLVANLHEDDFLF